MVVAQFSSFRLLLLLSRILEINTVNDKSVQMFTSNLEFLILFLFSYGFKTKISLQGTNNGTKASLYFN